MAGDRAPPATALDSTQFGLQTMLQAYRVLVVSLFALLAVGCTAEVDSGLEVRTVDESGDQVEVDELTIWHEGERDTPSPSCTEYVSSYYETGQFDIAATCGDTMVERTVRVREHGGFETVTLEFPEDACQSCS